MNRFRGYYVEASCNVDGVQVVKKSKYFTRIGRARTFAEECEAEGYDYVTIEYVRK